MESLVKRGFNVKDMGDVLPGMGGILDRIVGEQQYTSTWTDCLC